MTAKRCYKCLETKDLENFYRSKGSKDGRHSYCIECAKKYFSKRSQDGVRKRPAGEAEWSRSNRLKRLYGLTREEYDAMLAKQQGCCAGCDRKASSTTRSFHVDHDHSCCPGKITCGRCVRGLLCSRCNLTLGLVDDTPAVLRKLATYLESKV